jgi:hypothetical protein
VKHCPVTGLVDCDCGACDEDMLEENLRRADASAVLDDDLDDEP